MENKQNKGGRFKQELETHLCLYSCYGFNFYVRKLLGFCLLTDTAEAVHSLHLH